MSDEQQQKADWFAELHGTVVGPFPDAESAGVWLVSRGLLSPSLWRIGRLVPPDTTLAL